MLHKLRSFARTLTHAGIEPGVGQIEERQLVTGNIVVMLAFFVTLLTIPSFFTEHQAAATYAGISSAAAASLYALGFVLISLGRRVLGLLLFTNTVLYNLTCLTLLLGTQCGFPYYFVSVGVGAVLVWPRSHARVGLAQAALGLGLFIFVLLAAHPGPWVGAPLSPGFVTQIFYEQVVGAYVVAFGCVFYAVKTTELAEQALDTERGKSEALLLNILPAPVAERLKSRPESIADGFEGVTVLFADVVGFTPMSASLPPGEIVDFLNRLFVQFDLLAEKHGIEKIKTIGDAYMAVGGVPVPRSDHARAVVDMALGMSAVTAGMRAPDGKPLQLRIGISSGPATAGVIGIRKFAYDLWGDTVNTASRMESHGMPGEIQITESTYRLVKDHYAFEERGHFEIKGKGRMALYLVKGAKHALKSHAEPARVND